MKNINWRQAAKWGGGCILLACLPFESFEYSLISVLKIAGIFLITISLLLDFSKK